MNYQAYLKTIAWKERRTAALRRAGYRCQVCNGSDRLEVHHRTYERIGQEDPADLTVLCHECHELFSRRMQDPPYSWLRRIGWVIEDIVRD